MENDCEKICTKEKKPNELIFNIAFKKGGESFQNIMERILISKLSQEKN